MATIGTAPRLAVQAPHFSRPGTDGRVYSDDDVMGENGTVVAFICNHCPYVKAVVERMVADAKTLAGDGIGFVAINANDPVSHPEDSPANMKVFAEKHGFPFPYLFDEAQEIARAFDAACTPEFFGISRAGTIEYRGRLDQGRTEAPPPGAKRELVEAMRAIARTGKGPESQTPSVGCSIKWKR